MVDIGMRSDKRFAFAQRKIEFSNQFDAIVDRVLIANIQQGPLVLIVD